MEKRTILDLYPNLNDEQLAEAEDNLDQYLALIIRIGERIIDEKGHDEFARILEEAKPEITREIEPRE